MKNWLLGDVHPLCGEVCVMGIKNNVPYRSFRDRFGKLTMFSVEFLNKSADPNKQITHLNLEEFKTPQS